MCTVCFTDQNTKTEKNASSSKQTPPKPKKMFLLFCYYEKKNNCKSVLNSSVHLTDLSIEKKPICYCLLSTNNISFSKASVIFFDT